MLSETVLLNGLDQSQKINFVSVATHFGKMDDLCPACHFLSNLLVISKSEPLMGTSYWWELGHMSAREAGKCSFFQNPTITR